MYLCYAYGKPTFAYINLLSLIVKFFSSRDGGSKVKNKLNRAKMLNFKKGVPKCFFLFMKYNIFIRLFS